MIFPLLLALYRPESTVQPATDYFTQTWVKQTSGNHQGILCPDLLPLRVLQDFVQPSELVLQRSFAIWPSDTSMSKGPALKILHRYITVTSKGYDYLEVPESGKLL